MKPMMIKLRISLLALVVALAFAGCGSDKPEVTVFAAASLADVLGPLGERFQADQGIDVRFSFGGSWMLSQQISRGAPADIFLAAGPDPMDALDIDGLLSPGSRSNLLSNTLVIVGPVMAEKDPRDAVILTPTDLLGDDISRIAIGDPSLAPAGSYAREALQGMGLWDDIQGKLVYGLNVRTALQYVTSRNADVAIVYATDAASDDTLRTLWAFPPEAHSPIRYPVAALRDADNPDQAASFMAFLLSEEASVIFTEHGFTPIAR